jgi:hypothetical protein
MSWKMLKMKENSQEIKLANPQLGIKFNRIGASRTNVTNQSRSPFDVFINLRFVYESVAGK